MRHIIIANAEQAKTAQVAVQAGFIGILAGEKMRLTGNFLDARLFNPEPTDPRSDVWPEIDSRSGGNPTPLVARLVGTRRA